MKKVLSIAGSDCSGGAGIQADLKTFSAHGVFGMSVIVSVVAENTSRVIDIQDITPDMIEKQIDAVFEDIEVDAVKIGMLSTPECMKAVAKKLLQYKPQNVVIDPVMYAKNGCPLMNPTAVSTLIDTVIPLADVLTPNIPEAEKIADMQISTVSDMEAAARKIYAMGCKAIVVKGGHHIGNAVDVLFNGENFYHFETSRIDTKNTHGTGCTFSSAIASQLAKGKSVPLAVESAKAYVTMAIEEKIVHAPDVKIYGSFDETDRAPIVSLNFGDEDAARAADILWEDYGICVRAGAHCAPLIHKALGTVEQGMVRFSFSHQNTETEVLKAAEAVCELAEEG